MVLSLIRVCVYIYICQDVHYCVCACVCVKCVCVLGSVVVSACVGKCMHTGAGDIHESRCVRVDAGWGDRVLWEECECIGNVRLIGGRVSSSHV